MTYFTVLYKHMSAVLRQGTISQTFQGIEEKLGHGIFQVRQSLDPLRGLGALCPTAPKAQRLMSSSE